MSLPSRRAAVVALYLGSLLLGVAWCVRREDEYGVVLMGLMVLCGLISFLGLVSVWRAAHGLILTPAQLLDERQRGVRDRAYRVSYLVVSLAFVGASAIYSALVLHPSGAPGSQEPMLAPLGFGALLLTMTFPLAVVAWTEPDPPEDSGTFTKTAP